MKFSIKIESFYGQERKGRGVIIFEAEGLVDALRKAAEKIEAETSISLFDVTEEEKVLRVTVELVVEQKT